MKPKQNSAVQRKVTKTLSKKIEKVVKAEKKKHKEPKKPVTEPLAVPLHLVKGLQHEIKGLSHAPEEAASGWTKRVLIFTPTLGTVRMEWVAGRYGQIIPTNWSFVEMQQFLNPHIPIGYQLADAQNLMAKIVVEDDYDWIIYVEDDNILPQDAFLRMNVYMNEGTIPVVSGLYFLKSTYAEPLVYRGRGTSHFRDWKLGDRVWVDGIPFGCRLEHGSLIKEAWKTSEEYIVGGIKTRKVFTQPRAMWFDEEKGGIISKGGTTDLEWCTRLMDEKIFEKAGWPEFQKMKYPFLVDTRIFVKHIDRGGTIWPTQMPARYIPEDPNYKGVDVTD